MKGWEGSTFRLLETKVKYRPQALVIARIAAGDSFWRDNNYCQTRLLFVNKSDREGTFIYRQHLEFRSIILVVF